MTDIDIHAEDADVRVRNLQTLLDVEPVGDMRFEGVRKYGGKGRIFGGEVIAQALAAACKTVPAGRDVHSLHAYFLRGGDENHPSTYRVEADFDGGSFSNRRVIASQKGQVILNLTASFHVPEPGRTHQIAMPDVPVPEYVPDVRDALRRYREGERKAGPSAAFLNRPWPFEVRPIGPLPMLVDEPAKPETSVWFRISAPVDAPQWMHRAILAFVSDWGLLSASTLPHGHYDMQGASLDHSIWFHKDVRVDDWLLYHIESPWSGAARGLGLGRVFGRDGRLIASMAQEGLIRDRVTHDRRPDGVR